MVVTWTLLKCSLMGSGKQVLFNAESKMFWFALVLYLSNMKGLLFSLFFFFFLLTIGPPLPKVIWGFPMLEINGDTYAIGGSRSGGFSSSIYQLSCSSGLCSWTTLNQQLKVARNGPVAIVVQDHFCT